MMRAPSAAAWQRAAAKRCHIVIEASSKGHKIRAMDWLSDEQQAAWRPFVALLLRLPAALDAQLQKDAGITQFDYLVLSGLSEADDRTLRMSELAARANSSLSRLSHVVRCLEGNRLVIKRVCAEDGRVSEVAITKAGMGRVSAAAPLHVAKVRELVVEPLTKADLI